MFRKACFFFSCALLLTATASAESQTPRQALIEMFSAHDSKTFERHLPKIMQQRLKALQSGNGDSIVPKSMGIPGGMGKTGNMRWFETGSLLLLAKDPNGRLEVRIEKENLQGDRDDLELSWKYAMQGEEHEAGQSRLLLTMQREDGVWKLAEIGLTLKMKLDGSLLEAFSKGMRAAHPVTTITTLAPTAPVAAHTMSERDLSAPETAALQALRQLLAAQKDYRTANPAAGFSCDAGELGVPDVGGYRALIVGCVGTPITKFKAMLTPIGMASRGRRAFCADESGEVHYSDDGKGVSCLGEKNRIE